MNKDELRKAFDKILDSIPEGKVELTLDQKVDLMILSAKYKIHHNIDAMCFLWKCTNLFYGAKPDRFFPIQTTEGIIPTLEQIYSPKSYLMP